MDALRVTKVEEVLCSKAGSTRPGTVHLTAHHLIFAYDDAENEEMWIPYPLISLVTRMPQTLQGRYPMTVRTRTFETFTLSFKLDMEVLDVFDSVKDLTVAPSVTSLYAFQYVPNPPLPTSNGWSIYSPREEFGRMGVGTRTKAWRFTDINKDYSFCSTYPARLVIPTRISDTTLQYASKYRSKCRIPALTYLHWSNYGTLTRSSQPMVGLAQNRSIQDEKLIEAIFQSHHAPESRAVNSSVYGATATNIIIDARPTTNAVANTAKGAGTENMDHYKEARKAYLGIDNIHTMRDSLSKVIEALRETELAASSVSGTLPGETIAVPILDRQALRRSGWLRHISAIMEGTRLIVRNVHVNSSHVLIHCSDGWDRTAQLSALSQLCLDPFYRTMRGFQILIEKDWVSFGHKFLDRCGHLSSEKFFVAPAGDVSSASGADAAQAFFASVQNRFVSQKHLQETSPVFHQFLESVRQVQRQFPERFEFNERFLRQLHYHLYACQFGTFLFNSERERRTSVDGSQPPAECTVSAWDYFNTPAEMELNRNPDYDASLDDPLRRGPGADMGVLMINPKDVRFWHELYGRTDEEMNGKFVTRQVAQDPEFVASVESSEEDPGLIPSTASPPEPASSPTPTLTPSPTLTRNILQRTSSPDPRASSPALSTSHSVPPSVSRSRHDSNASFNSVPRSPSPRMTRSPRPPPSPRSASSDLFSPGGVRSMWGRLSSNATAALSAVQDVYGGVAKDLSKLSLVAGPGGEGVAGELKSRDEIGAWADPNRPASPDILAATPADSPATAHPSPSTSTAPYSYSTNTGTALNPWATTKTRPTVPSMLFDNPWGSPADSVPPPALPEPPRSAPAIHSRTVSNPLENTLVGPSSFASAFPTVAVPRPIPAPRSPDPPGPPEPSPGLTSSFGSIGTASLLGMSSNTSLNSSPQMQSQSLPPPPPPAAPAAASTDPLGVGIL